MNGQFRFDVDVLVCPGRFERLIGGGMTQLVTLRLHDGPGVICPLSGDMHERPSALLDLRPSEARELAGELIARAQQAETEPRHAQR